MVTNNVSSELDSALDFKMVFDGLPGCFMVLGTDAPRYTILAISDELLDITNLTRNQVVGKGAFEVYPENPEDLSANGPGNFRISLQKVIQTKEADYMEVVRYDVRTPENTFEERFWTPSNKPILNNKGEISFIIHTTSDITDQVKAKNKELALQGFEKINDLFMQAPVAVCLVTGPLHTVELINEEMLLLLGKTLDIKGKPLFEVVPEVIEQGYPDLLNQVKETGEPFFGTEYPASFPVEGKIEERFYNFIYRPYYINPTDKNPSGVFIVAHQVTDKVKARQKVEEVTDYLKFRNALFEAQNEVTPDGVLIVDSKGKMLLHNQLFVDIWKMPQAILESKDDNAALAHAMTQLADPEGYINRVSKLYAQQTEPAYDQILFKDGRVIERYGKPIVAEDNLYYGWAWYFRDITYRIRQEQKFRNVVEQATDYISIFKGEELILEVANQSLLELWQVGPEVLHKPLLEILPELRDQGFDKVLLQVMHSGVPIQSYEAPVIFNRKNGVEETRYFNISYQPYRESDKRITGVLVISSDVTDQVAGKHRLAESEARFKNLVMSAPVAIAVFRGEDFIAEIVNDAYLPLVGKTREEFAGKPLFESLPEAREVLEPLARELVRSGKPFPASEFELVLNRQGQLQTCYFNSLWQPLYEPDGRINGFIVVAHEITEQVKSRKKVEESEQQVRSFVESAPMPIGVYVGKEMRIQFANQAILDAWGKGNDVIGKLYADVLPELGNQDVFAQLEMVYTTGNAFHAKNQPIDLNINGKFQRFYFNYSLTPLFNASGKVYGVMNTAADVTDLALAHIKIKAFAEEVRESEQRFRIMADAAPNLVWALNPDTTLKYVNKTFLEFLGISLEKFITDNWVPYIHPEDLEETIQKINSAILNRNLFSIEHRLIRQDGAYRWLLSQGVPSYYPNGDLYGYVGSAIDITDIKEAEEALAIKNKQLLRINTDLDNFVYTASHDLRSPITNIEALSLILKEELQEANSLNPDAEDILKRIIDSVNRFKKTIFDLTEISRLQKDFKDNLKEEILSIPDIYEEIITDLSHDQYHKTCSFEVNFQVQQVSFSRKNFRSILYNLVSNAIKYQSPERDCKIKIETFHEGLCVVLLVKDNGLGLKERQQKQLFTMFKRFHDHVEGTGIGLYMVKRIIENAGGEIKVTSEFNTGTEFKIYFKQD